MINSLSQKLKSFSNKFSVVKSVFRRSPIINDSTNDFIVYLLRGKTLYAFLFGLDSSSSSSAPNLFFKNNINIDLPLTVLSDNRIDNEQELAEYIEDIVGFFDLGPTPFLLLLDPSYFFNIFIKRDTLEGTDILNFSPHIVSDSVYKSEELADSDSCNLSFASRSLLKAWTASITSSGSDCAYIGSLFYPLVQEISQKHNSFGLIDVHNSHSSLLLCFDGKLVSKFLPFGVNQYLIGDSFMADEFVNRLSKTIVKFSSDNAFSSPKNIYFLSDRGLDIGSSSFFNLLSISDLSLGTPLHSALAQGISTFDSQANDLNIPLSIISLVALNKILVS